MTGLYKQLSALEAPLNADLEQRVLTRMVEEGVKIAKTLQIVANDNRNGNMFGHPQTYFDQRVKIMLNGQTPQEFAQKSAIKTRVNQLTNIQKMAQAAKAAAESINESNHLTYNIKWWDINIGKEDALSQWGRLVNMITGPVIAQNQKIEEKSKLQCRFTWICVAILKPRNSFPMPIVLCD